MVRQRLTQGKESVWEDAAGGQTLEDDGGSGVHDELQRPTGLNGGRGLSGQPGHILVNLPGGKISVVSSQCGRMGSPPS